LSPTGEGNVFIRLSEVRNNARSGIFAWTMREGTLTGVTLQIERNRVEGNGASGIYLSDGVDAALLRGNDFRDNHDFGIAVGRHAHHVDLVANTMAHNGGGAVDIGLDGPTPVLPDSAGDRNAAVITSARYD